MNLPRYAYVLDVVYPPGTEWPWSPPGWEPEHENDEWHWPAVRSYFSRSGAKTRARLLESYGAKVTIIRSEPIEWKLPS